MEGCVAYNSDDVQGKILSEYPKYVVQDDGKIFSLYKNRYLPGNKMEYKHVTLTTTVNGKRITKSVPVHMMVATAYCPNKHGYRVIDHIDGNKQNNVASNLEWVSHSENSKRAHRMKRNTGSIRAVEQYTKDWEFIARFSSLAEATKATGVAHSGISNVINGKLQTSGGYRWKYADEVLEQLEREKEENERERDGEEWRVYEEELPKYEISNYGRVYSISKKMYVKPDLVKGYYFLNTKCGVNQSSYAINRLVAILFLELPENWKDLVVNHKDGNKLNNHVSNLEWVTRKQNIQHAFKTGLNKNVRPCVQYSLDGEVIAKYKSITEASLATGVSDSNIGAVCRGKRHTMGGFVWRFEGDPFERDGKKVYKKHSSYDKPCVQYKKKGNGKLVEIARYTNAVEAKKKTGIHESSIRMCCRGQYHSAGGSVWEYS